MNLLKVDLDGVLTDKGLRVVMPSGDGCYFVEEHETESMRHSYWRMKPDGDRGQRLTGTTTITKIADLDPKHLLRWAARTNGIGIATLVGPILAGLREGGASPDELEWLTDHESIWATLEGAQLTFDDVREAKATVGTNVHERVFRALADGATPSLEGLNEVEVAFSMGVMAFWLAHSPSAELAERIVMDPDLGTAGRPDFFGVLEAECDEELCPCHVYQGAGVIDAKTSGFIPASHHLQVAGYRHQIVRCGYAESTAWGAILQVTDEGGYRLIDAKAEPEDFVSAVALYRTVNAIDREAGKERKARDKARPDWRSG